MIQQRGMALLIVLIFLEISTLLGVSSLTHLFTETKMTQGQWQHYRSLSLAEEALQKAEKDLESQLPISLIPKMNESDLFKKLYQNAYIVEFLHEENCVDYFRITLLSFPKTYSPVVLQSIFAKPSKKAGCQYPIPAGILRRRSWQRLFFEGVTT